MHSDFSKVVSRILEKDTEAWKNLLFVSEMILKTWAGKEKVELAWMSVNKNFSDYRNIIHELIKKYIDNKKNTGTELSFVKFKQYLILEFHRILQRDFKEFLTLLRENDPKAWKLVYKNLEKKAIAFLYRKKNISQGDYLFVFSDAFETLYNNLLTKDVDFENSYILKSYFFKILEYKTYELVKDTYNRKKIPLSDLRGKMIITYEFENRIERNENHLMLRKALNKLTHDERKILKEYFYEEKKLKDIAIQSKQTEENVRVKKYRALKKLSEIVKKEGYGT